MDEWFQGKLMKDRKSKDFRGAVAVEEGLMKLI